MIQANTPGTRDFSPLEGFEAALDWWREAGVDCDFVDDPKGWLADPEAEEAVAAPAPPPPATPPRATPLQRALSGGEGERIGGDRAAWPESLEEFRQWWMTEPSLADGALDRRVAPRGVAGARLMVLVEQPDGDHEKLLAAMLRAMGIGEHELYFASALPAPLALPEWADLAQRGMGEVLRRHIALAAPQRILAVGRGQLALLDIPPEQARDPLAVDAGGTPYPLIAAPGFDQLARSAARRRNLWHRWLDWTA